MSVVESIQEMLVGVDDVEDGAEDGAEDVAAERTE
jgi:hypothetical protein